MDKLDEHIEKERASFGLTPREIGFIVRAWKAALETQQPKEY